MPPEHLAALDEHLGAGAVVRWIDMSRAGRNPGRLLANVFAPFTRRHRDPVMIGEPMWPGRGVVEQAAVMQHEAQLNLAFPDDAGSGGGGRVICPYDTRRLPDPLLTDAARTHPVIDHDGQREHSGDFTDPARFAAQLVSQLPAPPLDFDELVVFDADDVLAARDFAVRHARRAGLDERRVAEVELAIDELATNTVTHTAGSGLLRVWRTDTDVVCELRDRGHLDDPLLGRWPAPATAQTGHGLVMVHEVADLMFLHSDTTGTLARVHFTIPSNTPRTRRPDRLVPRPPPQPPGELEATGRGP